MWEQENRINLHIPHGRWLLADAGFPLCRELITPYRGVRYHLQEYRKMMARSESVETNDCHVSHDTFA